LQTFALAKLRQAFRDYQTIFVNWTVLGATVFWWVTRKISPHIDPLLQFLFKKKESCMKKKDIFSNCQQWRSEIEGIRRNLRGTETDLSQTQIEIQQLENAKIATRLEFGQASDIETVQTTENALREINNTLDAKRVERERL